MRERVAKVKNWEQFINEDVKSDSIEDLVSHIESFPKKIKINKPYKLYDGGLETAISNSEITELYVNYQRITFKKYIKSIPFPFEKMTSDNILRFNKLNEVAHIYESYSEVKFKIVKYICLHLMDIILYDAYFDIKSQRYDVYEKIDELNIPDKTNDFEVKKFGLWLSDKENPINYIIFYTNTNPIINRIRHY